MKSFGLKMVYEIFRQNQLSDLRIDHVERNDSGLYTCMVYNRLQNNLTKNGSSTIEGYCTKSTYT